MKQEYEVANYVVVIVQQLPDCVACHGYAWFINKPSDQQRIGITDIMKESGYFTEEVWNRGTVGSCLWGREEDPEEFSKAIEGSIEMEAQQ